jgi:hypothetical protein
VPGEEETMPKNILIGLSLLSALALLVSCQQSSARDDAFAECEASAIEAVEAQDPDPDQRATFREQHIRECMADKGFTT